LTSKVNDSDKEISIYARYGDFVFWHGFIYDLYLELFDHPEVSYHFLGVNLLRLSELQTQFLIEHIGGPKVFEGRSIKKVHRDMDITNYQFQVVAKRFEGVFLDNGISKKDTAVIMKFIAANKKDIVTSDWSPIDCVMMPIYNLFKNLKQALFFKW
jgi:truncated hemoglobin YjbI